MSGFLPPRPFPKCAYRRAQEDYETCRIRRVAHDRVRPGSHELMSVAESQIEGEKTAKLVKALRSHIRPHGDKQDAGKEKRRNVDRRGSDLVLG